MKGLLLGSDDAVAAWTWRTYQLFPMHVNRAIGIIDTDGTLVGSVLFQSWNKYNVDISYYGQDTMTPGIVHCLARIAYMDLSVHRVTAMTSKKNRKLIGFLTRLGFRIEGVQRRFYGPEDIGKNIAIRLVLFREDLERLAGFKKEDERVA